MTHRLSEPAVTKPVVPLAVGQVLALEAAMPARWRAMVSLGAATGPRVSEALGLTVNRIGLTGTGDVGRRKPGSPVPPGRSGCRRQCSHNAHRLRVTRHDSPSGSPAGAPRFRRSAPYAVTAYDR